MAEVFIRGLLACLREGQSANLAPIIHGTRGVQAFPGPCNSSSHTTHMCCRWAACMQEERETLREQLCAVPAEADPTDIAINVAKVGKILLRTQYAAAG